MLLRLSKELQLKDKLIESLRSKLRQQQQQPERADSPGGGSHSLSEQFSVLMDEQGSANEDLDLCSDLDTVSEFGQEEAPEGMTFKHTQTPCVTQTQLQFFQREELRVAFGRHGGGSRVPGSSFAWVFSHHLKKTTTNKQTNKTGECVPALGPVFVG